MFCSSPPLLGLASLIRKACSCAHPRWWPPPVPLRRLGALLRAPVPCGLPASSVAAPFPRRADPLKIYQLQSTATQLTKESSSADNTELLSDIRDKLPRAWLLRMVCVPAPALSGKSSRISH